MDIEIEIIKGIPVEQIQKFEDKTVYNCAVFTREITKNYNAYPYLSGTLRREEESSPIIGSNKEYGLTAGTEYAKAVWNMKNVNWTNPNTEPQWYYSIFNKNGGMITAQAVIVAQKEV